jgi:aryl-alcohol dehydrogenase-like predicted oxidoreductase
MLKGRATPGATSAYAARFASLPGHFRAAMGLSVSSIGIGTYLGEPDEATDRGYTEAIKAALRGGINLIDTAVNYRFQCSERSIGRALAEMAAAGELRREEVVVATKGGYLTFDGGVPANPREYFQQHYLDSGLIGAGELVEGSHCMAPRYIEAMLEMSRANLGLETIDVYYLHNPESQLAAIDRREFLVRIRAAFELLERKADESKIGVYGVATWNGFRADAEDQGYLSLMELIEIAKGIAGESHRFRMIQLPFNLAMPEGLTMRNQPLDGSQVSILQAAKGKGIAACASASLMQGRLSRDLPAGIVEAVAGFETDAQRSIQFVRSTPGVDVALVGMKSVAHVAQNLATAKRAPLSVEQFLGLFKGDAKQ